MNSKIIAALAALLLTLSARLGVAADAPSEAAKELRSLVSKIQTKLQTKIGDEKPTEKDLEAELKEFDTLLTKHKNEKTDDVAQILFMKATLYSQVLNDSAKSKELMDKLTTDFPDSAAVKSVVSERIKASLVVGAKFPDFEEKDFMGKPLSIAGTHGKVVLVDFWATWCGPCVAELPNVLEAYQKHHANGFEIVGISLDSDKAKLEKFIKDKNMPWQQYFDGLGWKSKLGQKYGVNSIPATYLLDAEGKIIAKDLRGEALEKAVAAALAKK